MKEELAKELYNQRKDSNSRNIRKRKFNYELREEWKFQLAPQKKEEHSFFDKAFGTILFGSILTFACITVAIEEIINIAFHK